MDISSHLSLDAIVVSMIFDDSIIQPHRAKHSLVTSGKEHDQVIRAGVRGQGSGVRGLIVA